jgi:hypothetical protein
MNNVIPRGCLMLCIDVEGLGTSSYRSFNKLWNHANLRISISISCDACRVSRPWRLHALQARPKTAPAAFSRSFAKVMKVPTAGARRLGRCAGLHLRVLPIALHFFSQVSTGHAAALCDGLGSQGESNTTLCESFLACFVWCNAAALCVCGKWWLHTLQVAHVTNAEMRKLGMNYWMLASVVFLVRP